VTDVNINLLVFRRCGAEEDAKPGGHKLESAGGRKGEGARSTAARGKGREGSVLADRAHTANQGHDSRRVSNTANTANTCRRPGGVRERQRERGSVRVR
jgi:hypothetical protein